MPAFHTTRRVEFHNTDAAGIMHFSAFFTMMEEAEHEMLRTLGTSVMWREDDQLLSWPRVSVRCDYRGAARFEDVLDIALRISRLGNKSVTYSFQFRRRGEEIAEGQVTAVCCRMPSGMAPRSIPIPAALRQLLTHYLD